MNRLILVGNGFDLAHGLKTSYCNFIRWYLTGCLNSLHHKYKFEDDLLTISHQYSGYTIIPNFLPTTEEDSISAIKLIESSRRDWRIQYKSNLLKTTLEKADKLNWVDIELEYFESLSKCIKNDGSFDNKRVTDLNTQFNFLKKKLEEYLIQEELKIDEFIPNDRILEIMKLPFRWRDFDTGFNGNEGSEFRKIVSERSKNDPFPASNLILNFNYTNTVQNYKTKLQNTETYRNTNINHIHGQLNKASDPIIFGFGDEFNTKYKEFEEQKNNDVFEHVKSYWYFRSANYRELVRYLNSDMFQVFIMGHSCGLSDRTMFREIFQHENCKSIKIFYYERPDGTNDFHEKTVELGRHFTDKGKMRKKIVEFDENCKFPQPKDSK